MNRTGLFLLFLGFTLSGISFQASAQSKAEFVIYGINHAIDLGRPDGSFVPTQKDFYVNMGSIHGLRKGTKLQVLRKAATYDVIGKRLFKDMTYPIATLKVIHVENNAAITRVDSLLPAEETPNAIPRAVIVGDLVRLDVGRD